MKFRHIAAFSFLAAALLVVMPAPLRADTLVLANGDTLTGELVRGDSGHCVFHSTSLGDVTVAWKDVKELQAPRPFVVILKSGAVQRGWLHTVGGHIELSAPTAAGAAAGAPVSVATEDIALVVDPATYDKAIAAHPNVLQGWKGAANGGVSLVSATQSSSSYTAGIDLQRPLPPLAWLPPKSDTHLTFQGTYGKITQPGVPTVLVSIYGGRVEQDEFVSKDLFAFGTAAVAHNRAQGLELQQDYGGGVGWKIISTAKTDLALKADVHWTHQRFLTPPTVQFVASSVTQSLVQKFGKLVWTESLSFVPSYTISKAYQANGLSSWALPVYHNVSVNVSIVDSYLGNPQPGFQHNSFQFSTGAQYALP